MASSGLPVTFSSQTTAVCTVTGNIVTGVSAGTCTIAANQSGNASYTAAAQVTQSFAIGQTTQTQAQTITFGAAPAVTVGGTGTVSATASSGLPVTFSSQTAVCAVTGNTVTGLGAGACIIAADQAGNANYFAAPQVTQSFPVGAAPVALLAPWALWPTGAGLLWLGASRVRRKAA